MLSCTTTTTRCSVPAGRASRTHRLSVTCFLGNSKPQQQSASVGKAVRVQKKPTATSSSPPALSKEEQESLAAALRDAGLPPNASAAELSKDAVQSVLSTIRRGLDRQEQDLAKLEGAMLLAEQLFHAAPGNKGRMGAAGVTGAAPQAVDMWQPIFASAGGFPRLLYIPVPEYFDMHRSLPDATAISISSMTDTIDTTSSPERAAAAAGPGGRLNIITELGPLTTHFLGDCAWVDDTTFDYTISSIRLDLGGRSISFGLGPLKLQNSLSFFLATPEVACARSRLGGTMLLAPEPAKGKAYLASW